MFRPRFAALVAALLVPALALGACGADVPSNSVAKVADQTIKKDTFDHWMRIASISSRGQANPTASTPPKAQIPDAPDFAKCVADKGKAAPKPAKGQPEPTAAQFKTQCKQEYDGLKNQVLQFLVRSTWLDAEAAAMDVKISDKEVQKQIDTAKKQAFPKPEDFAKFLTTSGLTEADVFFQQRGQLLEQKLTKQVTKGTDKVTDAQVAAYYEKNKQRFSQPERRDLRIVLTKDKARAEQAKAALDGGTSWKDATKRFSIDQASKSQGGKLPGVAKGQQEKALDEAIFTAQKGELTGPVKTQFGYYVLEVTKVTAAKQEPLESSKASIKKLIADENQRKALDKFGKDYRERWKQETKCREGFVVDDCQNAPKKKKGEPAVPPGGQGAPPQQQPPADGSQPQPDTAPTPTPEPEQP